ncbi:MULTISPECIES: ACT domain-containing protein [Pontibacillus]|uniref:UPF0237 protein GCM10011389_16260 n=2 Tax=Pontibacillus TaxID=289201 RepID=A0ABQ1Q1S0_9BACI|nr:MULTISPECIES: ACT domain-containing protein [Pontibacillus]MCD5322140.1 ACT domain-containing protein [Pontibacillus sp. HN14]QST01122.1 ACT domain-containing protein [Pontibacillus sp. ALD_SL1]WIF99437.1 ACT domain-containing protein [Pontibacillus chungwhensis]GGD09488.1 UPF0237 protein [Pontibacillus salipaludis]
MEKRKAVVSVIGKDQVGIIANVTNVLAEYKLNVLDISQTIVEEYFTMIMIIDVKEAHDLDAIRKVLQETGENLGVQISLQLEEVFQSMHRI